MMRLLSSVFLVLLFSVCVANRVATAALVDIGSQKQLFWDDYRIHSMKHVKLKLNPAVKAPNNPVIRADRPWEMPSVPEGVGMDLHYGTVFYDPFQQQFRMWYLVTTLVTTPKQDSINPVWCYATSKDGYHWEKPSLGLVEFEGSTDNNILKDENWPKIKGGIFVDQHEKDPAKRYKAMSQKTVQATVPGESEVMETFVWNLYSSPDAFNWTPHPDNPVIKPDGSPLLNPQGNPPHKGMWRAYLWGPTASMGWDPIRGVYAMHVENCRHRACTLGKRLIGRSESPDLVHWTQPSTIIVPDDQDPPHLEFYSMWTSTYEGFYIGMLWNYRPGPPPPAPRRREERLYIWPQFVSSRDGIHYDRRFREPVIPLSAEPEWDSVTIYTHQPIFHDGKFFIYYNGGNFRGRHAENVSGPGAMAAMGLATVPLDGFVSLDTEAGYEGYGEVVTSSFTFSGNRLQINMGPASSGKPCDVKVEILNPDHFRLLGYTFDDADSLTQAGVANVVTWKGKSEVSELAGQSIKLKFYLKNAKLFSFQFVPRASASVGTDSGFSEHLIR